MFIPLRTRGESINFCCWKENIICQFKTTDVTKVRFVGWMKLFGNKISLFNLKFDLRNAIVFFFLKKKCNSYKSRVINILYSRFFILSLDEFEVIYLCQRKIYFFIFILTISYHSHFKNIKRL